MRIVYNSASSYGIEKTAQIFTTSKEVVFFLSTILKYILKYNLASRDYPNHIL